MKNFHFILPTLILLFTLVVYFGSLSNGFVSNWDDGIYLLDNVELKSIDHSGFGTFVKQAFTGFSNGHYHPITTLAYGVVYKMFGLNPIAYHVLSLLIHLINSLLIYFFVRLLLENAFIAFFVSLLFAIHPMHVESVAWISDLKDLLCTLFYVSGLYVYVKNYNHANSKSKTKVVVLFFLALLSKSMAITMPFVLILYDFYKERKIVMSAILAKTPMILLSVLFAYLSVLSQKSSNALGEMDSIPFYFRICFASYALMMYLVKLVWFGGLSAFYNYPLINDAKLPLIYYLAVLVPLALMLLLFLSKWNKHFLWFCIGFFVITIFPVLQLVPAGNVNLADRYTYLPYLGLFILLGVILNQVLTYCNEFLKKIVYMTSILFMVFSGYVSYSRTKVWKDSQSLWDDTIKKNPQAALPYCNRGVLSFQKGNLESALADFNTALQLSPWHVSSHYNRGLILMKFNRYKEALPDFTYVLNNNPRDVVSVLMNRALAYTYSGGYMDAINDYTAVLKFNPNIADAYYYRALNWHTINQFPNAVVDLDIVLRMNPKNSKAIVLRGLSYYKLSEFTKAYNDLILAYQLGEAVDAALLEELKSKMSQ